MEKTKEENKPNTKKEIDDIIKEAYSHLTAEQKREHIDFALTTCAKILTATCVFVGAFEFIDGDVVYPDGSKWKLSFKKEDYATHQSDAVRFFEWLNKNDLLGQCEEYAIFKKEEGGK